MVLTDIELKEKHNITSDNENEEQNIEVNIKSRERYLKTLFLSVSDTLRYEQIKTDIKNNLITVM